MDEAALLLRKIAQVLENTQQLLVGQLPRRGLGCAERELDRSSPRDARDGAEAVRPGVAARIPGRARAASTCAPSSAA